MTSLCIDKRQFMAVVMEFSSIVGKNRQIIKKYFDRQTKLFQIA